MLYEINWSIKLPLAILNSSQDLILGGPQTEIPKKIRNDRPGDLGTLFLLATPGI
jgi:hypothetical protein